MTPPHQAHRLITAASRDPAATTPVVAITGGKGGVGKTVIATNLAILAQRAGYRTLLADVDPGLANVDVHLRIAPRFTLEELTDGSCAPSVAIVTGPGGISVLAGKSSSTRLAEGDDAYLNTVHEALARAAKGFDLLICDTGAGIGRGVIETVRRADLALAITSPEPAAVTDAYALCKVLDSRGISLPQLVMNRARCREDALRTGGQLAAVCERFLGKRPEIAGWLRADAAIERSVIAQRPCSLDAQGGGVLEDLRALAATMLSKLPPPRERRRHVGDVARRLLVRTSDAC